MIWGIPTLENLHVATGQNHRRTKVHQTETCLNVVNQWAFIKTQWGFMNRQNQTVGNASRVDAHIHYTTVRCLKRAATW